MKFTLCIEDAFWYLRLLPVNIFFTNIWLQIAWTYIFWSSTGLYSSFGINCRNASLEDVYPKSSAAMMKKPMAKPEKMRIATRSILAKL